MLHSLRSALSRAATLDPLHLRHRLLLAAITAVAATLIVSNGLGAALAVANESNEQNPRLQTIGASVASAPEVARVAYTVDIRPLLVYPVGAGAPVGSDFGPREAACGACSTMHQGVDWNPAYGTTIIAIADGVVSQVGTPGNSLGTWVAIDHVINGQAITSVYGHMIEGSMPYSVGDTVRGGDPVGLVGSTGVATAPHLHFELRIGGTAINPVPWMIENGAI